MRLSSAIIDKLRRAIKNSFGDVPVYLFGSRVNDDKIGGDIDLAIDIELSQEDFKKKRVLFKTQLLKIAFEEISVDVVPYQPTDELLAKEIARTGIRLF